MGKKWLLFFVALILVLIIDYPVFAIFLNAFRSTAEILSTVSIIPQHPSLENFTYLNGQDQLLGVLHQ